ncbi:MAG: hypothetical protein RQ715_03045 [Methylococcales bacterium]|nr:hypothetical protein [Methylococcales bacterium]
MNINPTQSALSMIGNAQFKADQAAQQIATLPVQADEVGSPNFNSQDLMKPIISLKEAELETSAAVKVIQADSNMLGSLLDIRV